MTCPRTETISYFYLLQVGNSDATEKQEVGKQDVNSNTPDRFQTPGMHEASQVSPQPAELTWQSAVLLA